MPLNKQIKVFIRKFDKIALKFLFSASLLAMTFIQAPTLFACQSGIGTGFYADRTLPDMLVRFPGIYRTFDGSLNFRGTGGRVDLLLNGHPTAYSNLGKRSYFLEMFSADAFDFVTLCRSTAPAAISGRAEVIDLVVHPSDRISETSISGVAGMGILPQYSRYGGPVGRAAVQYLQPLSENTHAGVRLAWDSGHSGREDLSLNFDAVEFNGSTRDVIRSVTPSYRNELSQRMSGSIWFGWSPSERTELTASLHHFQANLLNDRHAQSHDTRGDWLRPDTTGLAGSQGVARYEAATMDRKFDLTNLQLSGITRFDSWDIRYRMSWSHSDTRVDNLQIPFSREGTDFSIDMSDRLRPVMRITGVSVLENGTIDYRNMRMGAMQKTLQEHKNDLISAAIDVHYQPLGLSAGVDVRGSRHDTWFEQSGYSFFQVLNLYRFFMIPQGAMEVFGQPEYLIPWMVDTGDARAFLEGNLPRFTRNEEDVTRNSAVHNFMIDEEQYAAFSAYSGGPDVAKFSAGLRVEHTRGLYEGTSLLISDNGIPELPEYNNTRVARTDLLPFAHAKWNITQSSRLSFSFITGTNRADFYQLAPYNLTENQLKVIRRGNPELEPEYIRNSEVAWRIETEAHLEFSTVVFYRHISHSIVETSRLISGGEKDCFMEFGYENSGNDAWAAGIELQAEHRLTYLPGVLSGLTVLGNYTFSDSRMETEIRPDETFQLPGQSRHHLNAALRFQAGRLANQISYRYTSGALRTIAAERIMAPSASPVGTIYPDIFEPDAHLLTGSFSFRLSGHFSFWADAEWNPVGTRSLYYHSADIYPTLIVLREGFAFRSGVIFQF